MRAYKMIVKRPRGAVMVRLFRHGQLIMAARGENLFVNAGLPALASLIAGDTGGQFASAVGFGSGAAAPAITDTALTAPAYYKLIDSHAENGGNPGAGSVQFNWSLTTADSGAEGITIQELGLFANPGAIALPGANAPATLLARKTITPIVFGPNMSLTGTWTLTF
ncbi:MAG: hypothetical protein ACREP6_05740 [Candidatus Binataceae bacterium]